MRAVASILCLICVLTRFSLQSWVDWLGGHQPLVRRHAVSEAWLRLDLNGAGGVQMLLQLDLRSNFSCARA